MAKAFKATSVTVSRLKAGPKQYENERIEVEIAIGAGQSAEDAVAAGRAFIAKQFGEAPSDKEVANAKAVLAQVATLENVGL